MDNAAGGRLAARLAGIAARDERLVIGLSSGTSYDGIDCALVRVSGRGNSMRARLLHFLCVPYPEGLASRIADGPDLSASELARLDMDIGAAFGDAAVEVTVDGGVAIGDVDLIGSHGQTVYHEPPAGGVSGATLQIGQADVVARRTGVTTVSDFRTADVAAGGSGAPLVPLVDWLLFRRPGEHQVFLNVGGIANITYVAEELADVVAFDTGPGNALIDHIVRGATGRPGAIDEGGAMALSGTADAEAAARFLEHPYFRAAPPKSTGKELFGREAARKLSELVHPGKSVSSLGEGEVNDLLATAALVTARSVAESVRFLPRGPALSRMVVSGGGLKNAALLKALGELMSPCPVVGLDDLGLDPDAKEAVAFAVLADRSVAGEFGNVPAATGASAYAVLGKISSGL